MNLPHSVTQSTKINPVRNGTGSKHHHSLSKSQEEWRRMEQVQRHVGGSKVDEVMGCHRAQMRYVQDRARLRKVTDIRLAFPRPRGGLL
jgi:hypothetical protein